MASVLALSHATGFSRDGIDARVKAFGLKAPYRGKDIFDLKPIKGGTALQMSYEEARARETAAKAELAEIELETKKKERIPVEVLNAALAQAFAEIRATIDGSELNQKAKDDICEAIKNAPARLRW